MKNSGYFIPIRLNILEVLKQAWYRIIVKTNITRKNSHRIHTSQHKHIYILEIIGKPKNAVARIECPTPTPQSPGRRKRKKEIKSLWLNHTNNSFESKEERKKRGNQPLQPAQPNPSLYQPIQLTNPPIPIPQRINLALQPLHIAQDIRRRSLQRRRLPCLDLLRTPFPLLPHPSRLRTRTRTRSHPLLPHPLTTLRSNVLIPQRTLARAAGPPRAAIDAAPLRLRARAAA
ncbi:hypothetical protein AOQ84DRAFT_427466 [Glonium stellatum]|uniref:Uncharacterized protein n=1 Tax=Glonium stellatum TaxID=574774 RepID=A0A8E2F4U2_9PEZI|nr:hypothetical protein AOQ84DRAFT_427466 [Glonium stellatum]